MFLSFFRKKIRWLFIFVPQKSWKLAFETLFLGTEYPFVFVLTGREYSMDIVLSKTGVQCAYLRFLMYKIQFKSFTICNGILNCTIIILCWTLIPHIHLMQTEKIYKLFPKKKLSSKFLNQILFRSIISNIVLIH